MVKYLFIVNAGIGALMVILAIPMILQRIKPNFWYGIRTRKTLSDEKIWNPANQYAGKALLLAGIVMVGSSLGLYWVTGNSQWTPATNDALLFTLWLVGLFAPLGASVGASLAYLKRL